MTAHNFKSDVARCARRFFGGCLVALAVLLSASMVAAADDPVAAFEQGNKLYEQGKFSEAAAEYAKLIERGQVSPALHFNLGNALFKSGQIGRAIAHYRMAEQLTPRDPDIRANLRFARNSVGGPAVRRIDRWRGWVQRLTLNEWTALATGGFWLWLLLLTLGRSKPLWQQSLRGYTAVSGVATAILLTCLALTLYDRLRFRSAVVVAPEAVVRYGPDEESPRFYTARDGTELTVLDQKGDWLRVVGRVNRPGWVRREQVSVLTGAPSASRS